MSKASGEPTLKFRFSSAVPVADQIQLRRSNIEGVRNDRASSTTPITHLFTNLDTSFSSKDIEQIATKNCENLIGAVSVPVGIVGPVPILSDSFQNEDNVKKNGKDNNEGEGKNRDEALPKNGPPQQSILLPLATTEGALVASVSRGAKAIQAAGAARVLSDKVGITRAPVFKCQSGDHALLFVQWMEEHREEVRQLVEQTSNHLKLWGWQAWVRGRNVFMRFEADPDEAMGMNMITIGLSNMWRRLQESYSDDRVVAEAELVSISGNVCTDKKDSVLNTVLGRGYWVQAEIFLSEKTVQEVLKSSSRAMVETHVDKNLVGGNVAGSHAQNMQAANVAAAMFLATGQDMAHVLEAAQASTTLEQAQVSMTDGSTEAGLYVAVTAPNIVVGAVGGGTWLPAQVQARSLIHDGLTAQQLAESIVVGMLAAEISGLAALSSGQLAQAHQKLGRNQSSAHNLNQKNYETKHR